MKTEMRFDAAHHPILPRDGMIKHYANDPESLKVIRSTMPHRYVVIPEIQIRMNCADTTEVIVNRIYPGGGIQNIRFISPRALAALRRTFVSNKRWKHHMEKNNWIWFVLPGRVILDPLKRFGIWKA